MDIVKIRFKNKVERKENSGVDGFFLSHFLNSNFFQHLFSFLIELFVHFYTAHTKGVEYWYSIWCFLQEKEAVIFCHQHDIKRSIFSDAVPNVGRIPVSRPFSSSVRPTNPPIIYSRIACKTNFRLITHVLQN